MTNKQAANKVRAAMKGESAPDKREMSKLAKLIEEREYAAAYKHFRGMDTFVREGIPKEVVHHLSVKKAGGIRTITAHIRMKDCKKVFNEGWKPGVLMQVPLEFPKDVTDEQIATSLVQQNGDIVAKAIEVLYEEEGSDGELVLDTGRRW